MRFPRPERPFWNLLEKACYTFLDAGYWLAASCCTAAVALTADAAGTLEKKSIGAAAVPTKTRPCRTGKHHGPEGRTESKICVSRGRNVLSEISYKKLAIRFSYTFLIYVSHTFLNAGYWLAASCYTAAVALTATDAAGTLEKNLLELLLLLLLLVQLTLQKGDFRQGNPMLLRGDSDCCCCAHKDTALPDGEAPWPWRTNGVQNIRFPRPERPFWNLLQKACYTFLEAGCWLAASCCTAAVVLTAAASACVCCCLLMPAAACYCLRLPAACCWCCCWWLLLLWCCCRAAAIKQPPKQETTAAAAVPTKTRPCRTRKRHRPEGRTESKICVSRGRNVPSEISYRCSYCDWCCWNPRKKIYWSCCCAHKDTALPDGQTPWPWRTNGVQNMRFPRPERPFWNLLEKACYTFLNAGYWLAASCCTAAVALTATDATGTLEKDSIRAAAAAAGEADPSKRRFPARKPHATERRQRLLLLCPQRHSPAGRGNTMALKDERSAKYAFPEAGTSLLKSPTKSLLYVSRGWLLARC